HRAKANEPIKHPNPTNLGYILILIDSL
ncbi:hypothetical protein LCGC14_1734430, partial [marine sediment metagenome]